MRSYITAYYQPLKFFEMEWGVGGGWYTTNIFISNNKKTGGNYPLLSSYSAIRFYTSSSYLSFRLHNKFDIAFDERPFILGYAGGEIILHPKLSFLDFYLDTGIRPWFYQNKHFSYLDILLTCKLGARLNFKSTGFKKKTPNLPQNDNPNPPPSPLNYDETVVNEVEKSLNLIMADINFQANSTEISKESLKNIEEIYEILNQFEFINIKIEGHTNDLGNALSEEKLSSSRATAIKKILVEAGIQENRIQCHGYGSSKPKTNELSNENRRVEIKIIN